MDQQIKDNKLIIIEGPQGSGKTTLINSLSNELYIKYKLSPIKFTNIFNVRDEDVLFGACIGKDLSILNIFSKLDKPVVMDRGILSSLVYKHIRKELYDNMSLGYINYIRGILKINSIYIILIKGYNSYYIRKRKDGFDNISIDLQNKIYNLYIDKLDTDKIIEFTNDFNNMSILRFNKLVEEIIEYK